MFWKILKPVVVVLAAAVSLADAPARGENRSAPLHAINIDPVRARNYVLGPYATIRRANEVANIARRRGYRAIVYHNGNGWYVRVW